MYHLFAGENYYPSGGMGDYLGVFASVQTAEEKVKRGYDWASIAVIADDGSLKTVREARWCGPTVYCHDWKDV